SNPPPGSALTRSAPGRPVTPQFDAAWRRWLHDGVIPNTAFAAKSVTARTVTPPATDTRAGSTTFDVVFKHDPSVLDGRFANNGWLQELPKPVTKLTWDNAVLASPETVARLRAAGKPSSQGGEHGEIVCDVVEVRHRGRTIRGPLFPVVGHPHDAV